MSHLFQVHGEEYGELDIRYIFIGQWRTRYVVDACREGNRCKYEFCGSYRDGDSHRNDAFGEDFVSMETYIDYDKDSS